MKPRPRVLVCGATFGRLYLQAIAAMPDRFELVGLIGSGAARSTACAQAFGVPLYRAVDEAPPADIAIVVVRSGLLGGHGAEIAQDLLRRGVSVLQEHPLHYDELADCLRTARASGARFRLNPFHSHLPTMRLFTAAAKALLARQSPIYITASCALQTSFSLMAMLTDILGAAQPWSFAQRGSQVSANGRPNPMDVLNGVVAGTPLALTVQNQLVASDPDNFAHVLHRISIGVEGGHLLLANTHGPVLWSGRLHVPRAVRDGADLGAFEAAELDQVDCEAVGDFRPMPWRDVLSRHWPDAAAHAVLDFARCVELGESAYAEDQRALNLCRMAQDLAARLGPPGALEPTPPAPLGAGDFVGAPAELTAIGADR